MADITYKIELKSFWHAGTGVSGGTYADTIVMKDTDNLPFIPGKTLKGLLRDAANQMHSFNSDLISSNFINDVFGELPGENGSKTPNEAKSYFTDAYLSTFLANQLVENHQLSKSLYKVVSSTKIDSRGIAEDNSLRQIEVTIPLTLYAEILDVPEEYMTQLEHCFKWVKRLGVNRNRGLGRCVISIEKEN